MLHSHDQNITEGDYVANIGDAAGQSRIQLCELARRLADDLELALHRRMHNLGFRVGLNIQTSSETQDRISGLSYVPQIRPRVTRHKRSRGLG
jgi:hypothetical protein